MGQELKVGQRIDVYNVVYNRMNFIGVSIGRTYIGKTYDDHVILLAPFVGEGDMYEYHMFNEEVKPIGCFVVKEVYSNLDAETII